MEVYGEEVPVSCIDSADDAHSQISEFIKLGSKGEAIWEANQNMVLVPS